MANQSIYEAFNRLIVDYDLSIGFEQSMLDKKHDDYQFEVNVPYEGAGEQRSDGTKSNDFLGFPKIKGHFITVDYKAGRLEDVLNDIFRQMKNYSWTISDDMIEIFPIRGRDSIIMNLMNLHISEFMLGAGTKLLNIKSDLIHLPEVQAFLARNDVEAETGVGVWYTERYLKEEKKYSAISLKDLLNGIVKIKRGGWIVKRSLHTGAIDIVI
ncbi:MAG: hypothetical protein ABIP75_18220 [Pyrinomonadaceae bacterium]